MNEKIKNIFLKNNFELCDEDYYDDIATFVFIKKDFKIDIFIDYEENEINLALDRPYYNFTATKEINNKNIDKFCNKFIKKINQLITKDNKLKTITKKDCELFLNTGNYDGMSSGVIEFENSLYYIQAITNSFSKERSTDDRKNRVWRNFYVHKLTKKELDIIVMSSLDWLRHINLTSLCKDWTSMRIDIGNEQDHKKHFNGKYRKKIEIKSKPIMKLVLHY